MERKYVKIQNFMNAVEVLKQKKRMSLEEFAYTMGYVRYDKGYMIHVIIPRALALVADEYTRKCVRIYYDYLAKDRVIEWICSE